MKTLKTFLQPQKKHIFTALISDFSFKFEEGIFSKTFSVIISYSKKRTWKHIYKAVNRKKFWTDIFHLWVIWKCKKKLELSHSMKMFFFFSTSTKWVFDSSIKWGMNVLGIFERIKSEKTYQVNLPIEFVCGKAIFQGIYSQPLPSKEIGRMNKYLRIFWKQ